MPAEEIEAEEAVGLNAERQVVSRDEEIRVNPIQSGDGGHADS